MARPPTGYRGADRPKQTTGSTVADQSSAAGTAAAAAGGRLDRERPDPSATTAGIATAATLGWLERERPDLSGRYRAELPGARAAVLARLWGALAREPLPGIAGRQRGRRGGRRRLAWLTSGTASQASRRRRSVPRRSLITRSPPLR